MNNHDINVASTSMMTATTQHHHYHHRFSSDNSHKTTIDWGLGMHGQQWERAQTTQGTLFEP
jgi:hypothetical protein